MMPMTFRAVFLGCAGAAIACTILAGCSPASLGGEVEYSCTDDGMAKTLELAQEIGKAIRPGYVASLEEFAHGCDSTTREVYEFDLAAKPTIIDRFNCQADGNQSVYKDGMLCRAKSGDFALYPIPEDDVVFVEALP